MIERSLDVQTQAVKTVSDHPTDPPILIGISRVAALTSLGVRTIYRLVSKGQFPAPLAIGGRRLWHRPTLEQFLATQALAKLPEKLQSK